MHSLPFEDNTIIDDGALIDSTNMNNEEYMSVDTTHSTGY